MPPKLSIITICYNEPHLEETCESIVNQTWQDFEWIVVDGGSAEETQKIFDKYKYRIDKFISEPDNGRYNAMNKGIKLAQGEWLNFMNAGDYYFHNDILRNIFEEKIYFSDVLYGFEDVTPVYDSEKKDFIQAMPTRVTKEFFIKTTLRHQASFIRKNLFKEYGLYDETYIIYADVDKWLHFCEHNVKFERLPYIVSKFNLNGISSDNNYKILSKKEKLKTMKRYFKENVINDFEKSKLNLTFIEKLFSVTNSFLRRYKIITIFGIQIKINRIKK